MGNMDDYRIDDYKMLDLEPGESLENIKQAYRDLAFIWHPDRIPNNSRLKHKAEIKIKEINEAYQRLRFYQALLQSPPSPIKVDEPVAYKPVTEPIYTHNHWSEWQYVRESQVYSKYWAHPSQNNHQDNSVWLY